MNFLDVAYLFQAQLKQRSNRSDKKIGYQKYLIKADWKWNGTVQNASHADYRGRVSVLGQRGESADTRTRQEVQEEPSNCLSCPASGCVHPSYVYLSDHISELIISLILDTLLTHRIDARRVPALL